MTTLTSHAVHEAGFDWIGAIPPHWNRIRNAGLFRERNERGREDLELLAVTIAHGVLPQREYMEMSGRRLSASESGDLSNYKLVRRGDLVYNRMRMWQGAIGLAPCDGIVSPAYVVLKPLPGVNPRYFEYLFKTQAFICEAGRYSYGIADDQNSLRFEDFKTLYSAVPPFEEQRRIAAFLDHETARIDELVREQERLNALLQEHKSALILDVVTKGLDQRRELVPSGVFWIGQVPEGWAVAKLGLRYEVQLGKMLDAKQNVGGVQYPYLRNQDVQWDLINTNNLPTFRLEPTELVRYQVLQGDIMVCEGGDVGRAAMWTRRDGVFAYQKALHRLRPKNADRDFPSYLLYALRAAKEAGAYEQNDQRSTISHLTAEAFREYKFPFPPIDEQRRIVEYLDREVSRIEDLAAASRAATELLLERRSALISAAVTGQLDLRDWQAPEPQEAIAEVA